MNYNYPYDMFNQNYLNSYDQQAYDAQRQHLEQLENLNDLQKAVSDFLDAYEKVRPEYQQYARQAFTNAVISHMMKKNWRGQIRGREMAGYCSNPKEMLKA